MAAQTVTILYPDVAVHKAGCLDIKRNRRGWDSSETVTVSSLEEVAAIAWADQIAESGLTAAEYVSNVEPYPCVHLPDFAV